MKLIADSGSTKTDWLLLDKDKKISFQTGGINPLFLTEENIKKEIQKAFPADVSFSDIRALYFYAAGCSTKERCFSLQQLLQTIFTKAEISTESDLLGAARALFQHEKGLACILGTGSNSCVYDGKEIVQNVTSLGYILGDEGSGAHIGKNFLIALLNNELPQEVLSDFEKEFSLEAEEIVQQLYTADYPSRFLASFAPFVAKHLQITAVANIVEESFALFFKHQIDKYKYQNLPIAFVGSIAWNFQTQLSKELQKRNFEAPLYLSKPIEKLAEYHA